MHSPHNPYAYPGQWHVPPAPPGYPLGQQQVSAPYPGAQMPPQAFYGAAPGTMPMQPMQPPQAVPEAQNGNGSLVSSNFVKGALIGAVAAYLLTNDSVQQGVIKAAVKSWSMVQGGVEEMKERFRDAEAELHAANMDQE